MTLTELLLVISIMGVLTAVIATTITVAFRTVDSNEGRANVARAEQSLDLWLPADLRSIDGNDTSGVDLDPAASPCGDPVSCDGIDMSGANALQLSWTTSADLIDGAAINDTVSLTNTIVVQYQYIQLGGEWVLQRVECSAGPSCQSSIVIDGLDAPPASPPAAAFNPDTDSPTWAMSVSQPTLGDAPEVTVTINGGGDSDGSGGGENTVTLAAGGFPTGTIPADEFAVEAFNRAKSRCSGRITLLVDHSGSIGSTNLNNVVKPGVQAFIDAFRGKPVQVQVVLFGHTARAVQPAPGNQWHYYVDMRDEAAVNGLVSAVSAIPFQSNSTNWEEGFFHATKEADGQAAWLPSRIILFTDGVPTSHRQDRASWVNGAVVDYNNGKYTSPLWPDATGYANDFNQEAFDRTDVIVDQIRGSVDLIFVGVGPDLNSDANSNGSPGWIHNRAAYTNRDALPNPATTRTGSEVLERLLTGDDSISAVEATTNGSGEYDNVATANYYRLQSFQSTQFADAMRTTALKDCGGTVSIETVKTDGTRVADEFIYENTDTFKPNGDSVELPEPRQRTTTSENLPIGTLDWSIPPSINYYEVELTPQVNSMLDGYDFHHWECAFGSTPKAITTTGSDEWKGVRVKLRANEALNCKMVVTVASPT